MSERDIFVAAFQRPRGLERERYLDEACQFDNALRQRVEKLLGLAEEAGSFLEQCGPDLIETASLGSAPIEDAKRSPPSNWEEVESSIGPYKLIEVIGEGGMGTVWLAEQREPVRRLVP